MHFEEYGYSTRFLVGNMGTAMWIIYAYLFLGLTCLLASCIWKWLYYKLSAFLLWNGFIRLFMEVFQELALHSALNLHTIDWGSPFGAV